MNYFDFKKLPYSDYELEPALSSEQLTIHSQKHHQKYVENSNKLIDQIREAQDYKGIQNLYQSLCFNVGGILLHNIYFANMKKPSSDNMPFGASLEMIIDNFETFDRFKNIVTSIASNIQGNGWVVAFLDTRHTGKVFLSPVQNHNLNIFPEMKILLAIDVWEHAYYVDYRNEKSAYINNFFELINWNEINNRIVI